MLFDDTCKLILEDLDSSFSQLFKYRGATASATQQGPTRFGKTPDGFKGSKDGVESSLVDSRIFPQTQNPTKKQLKEIKNKKKTLKKQRDLIKALKRKKYGK